MNESTFRRDKMKKNGHFFNYRTLKTGILLSWQENSFTSICTGFTCTNSSDFGRGVCISHCIVTFITHITNGNFGTDNSKTCYRKTNMILEMLTLYALFIHYEQKALKSSADCGSLGGSKRWLNILHSIHRVSNVKWNPYIFTKL